MNKKVVVGGTFDLLHKGHKELLMRASTIGEVKIGLTSDEMAEEMKGEGVQDYIKREADLLNFLPMAKVEKIEDPFAFSLEEDFDCIVVSKETRSRAEEINRKRKERGRKEIIIEEVNMVFAEDGNPISSNRIRRGEIDKEGNLL